MRQAHTMSALGHKRTNRPGPISTGCPLYPPIADIQRAQSICPLSAKSGLMQRSKEDRYSITSSAMENTPDGTSMPSARAV